jgi:spermidine/putrescine transport system substrate-binding protein
MKKINFFVIINLLLVAILFITSNALAGNFSKKVVPNELYIYNWGDYIDKELVKQFEEETSIKVIYQTFDSNEALLTKIEQGGTNIDLAVPSEYAIQKLISKNLLSSLDYSKIPNYQNVDDKYKNKPFDPNNTYSVPYFWGTVGILYNKNKLSDQAIPSKWSDLWNDSYKNEILLFDGARETLGFSLQKNGFSLNDTNRDHLEIAYNDLLNLKKNVKGVVGDEIKDMMARGEAKAAVTFSGEAYEAMSNNPDLDYIVPSEGSNIWFDNLVVPENAQNKDNAHAFINFMLDKNNAKQNAMEIGYSSPVASVKEELADDTNAAKEKLNNELIENGYCGIEQSEDCNQYDDSNEQINLSKEEYQALEDASYSQDIPSDNPEETYQKLESYINLSQDDTTYYSELFLRFKMSLN